MHDAWIYLPEGADPDGCEVSWTDDLGHGKSAILRATQWDRRAWRLHVTNGPATLFPDDKAPR